MKWLLILFSLAAASAQAQIFRCDTADGLVFSDTPCSKAAKVVDIEDSSAGIEGGPPEEVVAELDEKKAQRAEEREQARKLRASQPQQPMYAPVATEPTVVYPGYWPWRPGPRPHPRPPRPRPQPEQPTRPPMLPGVGNGIIRFPKG